MMRGIFTLFFCLGVSYVFGQVTDDYRTIASGSWSPTPASAVWQRYNGSAWVAAVVAPTTAAIANNITITAGHTITFNVNSVNDGTINLDGTVILPAGRSWSIPNTTTVLTINGSLQITGGAFSRTNGANANIIVNGTIYNTGAFTSTQAARMQFNAGSLYEHASIAGAVPNAAWNINSTCRITGPTIFGAPGALTQNFGNFEWNTPGLGADIDLQGNLVTVRGSLSITDTNGHDLILSGGAAYTLNVGAPQGGSFTIGSNANVIFSQTTLDVAINVNGNFSTDSPSLVSSADGGGVNLDINGALLINAGTFDVSSSTGQTAITLAGDYTKTGSLVSTGAQPLDMTFDGSGVQNFTSTTVPGFPINYSTAGTSNLTVAATSHLSGPGSLNILPGTSLTVTNTGTNGAIRNSNTIGNVRVSGTRTYGGTIIYGGAAKQYMYADTPNTSTIINNALNVDMRQSVTFTSGTLTLQTGYLRIGNTTLTVGSLAYGSGSFGYNSSSSLVLNATGSVNLRLTKYGGTGINNLSINGAGGTVTQVASGSSLRVNGTLALSNGTYALTNQTLQVYGPLTAASGGALSSVGGSLYVRNTGALPITVPLSGTLAVLEVNRFGQTFTTTGAVTITRLNLYGGDVTVTGGSQMANGGTIYRSNGALIAAIGAAGTFNVQYTTFSAPSITTGYEIPSSITALNTVTINNTANTNGLVSLDKPIVAAGQVRVWRGQLQTNNLGISTGGNFRVDGTGKLIPGESTFTFTGAANQSYNTLASAFAPYTLMDIVINKTAGTFTLSTAVSIRNSFAVNSLTTVTAGTNRLTLLSNADLTAYIPAMPGTSATSRGRINGTVIVQRYLPNANSTRQYRYLSAPTTNTMVSDWQNEIPISGPFSNPSTGVFDGVTIVSAKPSMFTYNNATAAYVGYPASGSSTVAAIQSGRGYSVYGRTHTVTPLVLDSHGTLGQYNINVAVTYTGSQGVNAGYNLVGNPYPAPISWNTALTGVFATSTGIGSTIYFTDNNSGPTTGLISYSSTGVAVPAGSFDGKISMGQGFWVTANPGGGTKQVRFRESNKVAGQSKFIRQGEPGNLLRVAMTAGSVTDHLAVLLMDSATSEYDYKYDGYKFEMPGASIATLSSNNERLVINAIARTSCSGVVPIDIAKATTGNYTFNFTGLESFDAEIKPVMIDKIENKTIDLATTQTYTFSVTDITKLKGRFELRFDGPAVNTQLVVKGESTCLGNSTAVITLPSSQSGVQYTALVNGSSLSAVITGNGGALQIPVNVDGLPQGATEVVISAQMSNCATEMLAQKATITVLRKPTISNVTAGQVCGTGTTSLSATAVDGSLYNWYETIDGVTPIEGQHIAVFTTPAIEKTKTYFVAGVNEAGCEGERVEVKANVLHVTPAAITLDGNVLTSNYESGNQWYLDGTLIEGATGKTIEASATGVYAVVVNTGSCTSTSEGREMVVLGAESNDRFIRVYPNPAPDKVNIEVREKGNLAVELISTTGVLLRSTELSGSDDLKTASFDINSLPDGMYLVRVKVGTKTFTKKILKAK